MSPAHPRQLPPNAAILSIAGSLIVGLVVLAFLWPAKTMGAHDLPVGIAGPDAAVTAAKDAAQGHGQGAIDFVAAADRDDVIRQIETRETYGGIVLSATAPPEVLTAPAGSAAATQLLTGLAAQLQAQVAQQAAVQGAVAPTVTVTEVVPLASSDPSGAGLAATSFPMMLGGMLGGVLVAMLVAGPLRRIAALGGFSAATGLVLALVLHTWFEFLQGNFWLNALALGVSILATAAFIVGCASLLGRAGIGIGVVVTMLLANPISAAATPWQFLASPWGAIGQFFVPGASNWLLRSLSYFPAADDAKQWWILIGWIVLGIALTLAARRGATSDPASTPPAPEPAV